jgi:hypothetical protein
VFHCITSTNHSSSVLRIQIIAPSPAHTMHHQHSQHHKHPSAPQASLCTTRTANTSITGTTSTVLAPPLHCSTFYSRYICSLSASSVVAAAAAAAATVACSQLQLLAAMAA